MDIVPKKALSLSLSEAGLTLPPRQPNHAWQNLWGSIFLKTHIMVCCMLFVRAFNVSSPSTPPQNAAAPRESPAIQA